MTKHQSSLYTPAYTHLCGFRALIAPGIEYREASSALRALLDSGHKGFSAGVQVSRERGEIKFKEVRISPEPGLADFKLPYGQDWLTTKAYEI